MTWQLKLAAYLISLVLIAVAIYSIYRYGRHVDNLEWTAKIAEQNDKVYEENQKILLGTIEKQNKAKERKDATLISLNPLLSDLHGMPVVFPTGCPDVNLPSTDSIPSSGVASERNDSDKEEAKRSYTEAERETDDIIEACYRLNLDVIEHNEAHK